MANKTNTSILVVEDDFSLREAIVDTLELAGYDVLDADNGRMALDIIEKEAISLVISDVQMPKMNGHQLLKQIKRNYSDIPVLLMTAYGTIDKAIEAMKDGAADYLVKPFEPEVLVATISQYISQNDSDFTMIAIDPIMQEVASLAKRVAGSDATVMISGKSGTGKEVIAKYIHKNSPRANKPFVAINCAAIPENMLEATLFGYEKGAFTGAYKASSGKFEQAQGGTLLLDEISEMDLALQAKILRVIQEKEVERLGGHELIDLDVRILATSNRNIREYVKEGKFREDLYYRLNVFPILLPELQQRKHDIIPLAKHLIEKISRSNGKVIPEFSQQAQTKLINNSWPGNVRELDNVLQRAFILHLDDNIQDEDIIFEYETYFSEQSVSSTFVVNNVNDCTKQIIEEDINLAVNSEQLSVKGEAVGKSLHSDLKNHEFQVILDILQNTLGNRKITAERLGISQRTLRYKLAKMRDNGINIPTGYGHNKLGVNPA
ncbi:MAG: sigma-54 dependent transcriptional regulator [Pseudomonadota bacterium]